jgi:hypothetical protein
MNRGKIVIILCMVLLSIQIVSADVLNLTASTNETFADNRYVQITANLTNATGYPINDTRVNFTTDYGILDRGNASTNDAGIATAYISSWDLCTANITGVHQFVGSLYRKHHSRGECRKRDSQCDRDLR